MTVTRIWQHYRIEISILILLFVGSFLLRPQSDYAIWGVLLWNIGCVIALLSARLVRTLPSRIPHVPQANISVRKWALISGFICLFILAEINGALIQQVFAGDNWVNVSGDRLFVAWRVQAILLFVGVALCFHGIGFCLRWSLSRLDTTLLISLILFAFIIRVIDVANAIHTPIDEFHMIKSVVDLRQDTLTPILAPFDQIAAFTWIYSIFQWISHEIFGSNLTALRIPSAIFGALTVGAVYGLVRMVIRHCTWAICSALILATFPPHVHFSRLGLLLIVSPFIGTLIVMVLIQAFRTRSRQDILLTGMLIGLLPYFDEAGELLYPLVMISTAFWFILINRYRFHINHLFWLIIGTLLTSFPVFYTLLGYRASWFSRFEQNNIRPSDFPPFLNSTFETIQFWFNARLVPPFAHLVHLPDTSALFYLGETGMVLWWVTPLMILGVFAWIRQSFGIGFIFFVWFIGVPLGNSLIEYHTWTARYMPIAPVLAIAIAGGIIATSRLFAHRRHIVVIILTTLICIGQLGYYAFEHLPHYRENVLEFGKDYADVAWRVRDLPENTVTTLVYQDAIFGLHYPLLFEWWGVNRDLTFYADYEITRADVLRWRYVDQHDSHVLFYDERDTRLLDWLQKAEFIISEPIYSPYPIHRSKMYPMVYLVIP